jgi:hypothetical protein
MTSSLDLTMAALFLGAVSDEIDTCSRAIGSVGLPLPALGGEREQTELGATADPI